MKLNEINYEPLKRMNNAWKATLKEELKMPVWLSILIIVISSSLLIYFTRQFGFFLVVLLYSAISEKVISKKAKIWKDFAIKNGWQIIEKPSVDASYIPPGIYGQGHSAKMGSVVHANIDGHWCDVFMYQFTTGSGKNSQTHYYTVARVDLQRTFPHIILDSKQTWSLRGRGDAVDTAKLEGDFNKYFNLRYRKDDHVNALSVITPDVMRTLIENNSKQDIEIADSNLFFMINSDQLNAYQLPVLFKSVDALADEISHKAKTINYAQPGGANAAMLSQVAGQYFKSGDMVATELSKTIMLVIALPFIFVFILGFAQFLFTINMLGN